MSRHAREPGVGREHPLDEVASDAPVRVWNDIDVSTKRQFRLWRLDLGSGLSSKRDRLIQAVFVRSYVECHSLSALGADGDYRWPGGSHIDRNLWPRLSCQPFQCAPMTIDGSLLTCEVSLELLKVGIEYCDRRGAHPEFGDGGVSTPDPEYSPTSRLGLKRCDGTRDDRRVAREGIGDTHTQLELTCGTCGYRESDERIRTEALGVAEAQAIEALCFRSTGKSRGLAGDVPARVPDLDVHRATP